MADFSVADGQNPDSRRNTSSPEDSWRKPDRFTANSIAGCGYFRAAQAYMLISMPTGTSTILGVFQAILVSLPIRGTGFCILINGKANMEFPNRAIEFEMRAAQVCERARRRVQRTNALAAMQKTALLRKSTLRRYLSLSTCGQ
jgi:hypothetical protein